MRIAICGDDFGVRELMTLLPSENIVVVIAAEIRPKFWSLIQQLATLKNIPCLIQPKADSDEYSVFIKKLQNLAPDLIWIHSYSMLLRPEMLAVASRGAINIHYSHLPKYRGCNPVQWAIIQNEKEIGCTLHEVTSGADEGPIIDQITIPLLLSDTSQSATKKLNETSRHLIRNNLPLILNGSWHSEKQKNGFEKTNKRRTPADGEFGWNEPLIDIWNKIRALLPPLPPAWYVNKQKEQVFCNSFPVLAELLHLKQNVASEISGWRHLSLTIKTENTQPDEQKQRQMKASGTIMIAFYLADVSLGNPAATVTLLLDEQRRKSPLLKLDMTDWHLLPDALQLLSNFMLAEFRVKEIRIDTPVQIKQTKLNSEKLVITQLSSDDENRILSSLKQQSKSAQLGGS